MTGPLVHHTSRYADGRYAAQRRAGFPWLQFAPALEQEYRDGFLLQNASRLRLAHGFGLAALLGFILIDTLAGLHAVPAAGIWIMLVVTAPALAVPLLATAFEHPGMGMQRVVFISGLVLGLSLTGVVELGRYQGTWFPYEALLLVIMYVYLVAGLLFYQAAIVGLSVWGTFMLGENLWQAAPTQAYVYEAYFLFVANVIGLMGLYALQYDARKSFLMQNELRQEAMLDSLTGVLNRREFRRHLDAAWLQARREHANIAVLMLDIDNFKTINDTHGHMAGDTALSRIGEVLCSLTLRPFDMVGRYGGDEFLAVWYGVEEDWFSHLAATLPAKIANAPGAGTGVNLDFRLSVSGGAVLAWPDADLAPHDAIRLADQKLYEMKRNERGTIALAVLQSKSRRS